MTKKALLVIDMLNDFINPDGALYIGGKAEAVTRCVKEKIEDYRRDGNPVLFIMDRHHPEDEEFKIFPPHSLEGERGSEVVEELKPRPGEREISKRRFSAFFGTDLDLSLREMDINEIELSGVVTQICILYTAAEARMLHYGVQVDSSCVASFDSEAHRFALQEMEKTLGVNVL